MILLRKPMFSSQIIVNMCKGHMSLLVSLNNNVDSTSRRTKVNKRRFMTITTTKQDNDLKMSPSPPSPTAVSNHLSTHSIHNDNIDVSSEHPLDTSSGNNSKNNSELIKLGKEFNKFYFNICIFRGVCCVYKAKTIRVCVSGLIAY